MTKPPSVITGSVLLAAFVGTLNSVFKNNAVPGPRFYIGNVAIWLILAWLSADYPELATSIATAYAVFVVLGQGGGVVDHFTGRGTSDGPYDTQPNE